MISFSNLHYLDDLDGVNMLTLQTIKCDLVTTKPSQLICREYDDGHQVGTETSLACTTVDLVD